MRIRIWAAGAAISFGVLLTASRSQATDYYVSPSGSDSNPGTMAAPFGTVQKAVEAPSPGDTVWFRAGTYKNSKQIVISKSGTSDTQRINFFAYQGEVPVLDFSTYVSSNTASDQPTIHITGSWLHFKGLEVANGAVQPSGSHSNDAVRASNTHDNIFELLNIHHNFGPGLFIDGGTGGHLILNCDSHDNYDKDASQGDGQNGDGFGVHYQMTGSSTVLRGNRAWINSDDGYDLISQEVPVIIENCWAVMNGYANGGSTRPSSGNGNGFKAGSSKTGIRHVLQQNVAWKNGAAGFYANHSSGGNTWLNNTSYMNSVQYNMLASPSGDTSMTITLTGALAHKMRNNIGFPNKNTNMGGVDTQFNTWDLGIAEASNDFASTVDTGYSGPRQADGSLPNLNFMKLAAGSPLIDKGTDVGLAFAGAHPDLGAYEYGVATNTGNAGSTGSGGTSATGAGGAATGGTPGSGGGASAGSNGSRGGTVGTTGTGGLVGTTGGATGSGGGTGAGGSNPGSGGSATGGVSGAGTGGSGGPEIKDGSSGCSCAIDAGNGRLPGWLPLFGLALASFFPAPQALGRGVDVGPRLRETRNRDPRRCYAMGGSGFRDNRSSHGGCCWRPRHHGVDCLDRRRPGGFPPDAGGHSTPGWLDGVRRRQRRRRAGRRSARRHRHRALRRHLAPQARTGVAARFRAGPRADGDPLRLHDRPCAARRTAGAVPRPAEAVPGRQAGRDVGQDFGRRRHALTCH